MKDIDVLVNENGFQNTAYNNPKIPIYLVKGNLSLFDYRFKPHWHRDFEIVKVINGSMKYNIDGRVIELQEGDVLFVNSDRMHFGYSESKNECNYICLVFDYKLLCENDYIANNYVLSIAKDECCPYLIIKNEELSGLIDKLYVLYYNRSTNDLKIQSCLFNIFSYIFEAFTKSPSNKIEKSNFSKIREMINFINYNYKQKTTLAEIAKAGNVSKNTCINYFKENLNQSPIEYLIAYRLEKSIELLTNTDLTITQIANEVGFSSSSHFCELFKKHYKSTPSEYRNGN